MMFGESDAVYDVRIVEEDDSKGAPAWTASHPALPGCNASGRTMGEAVANLAISREAWMSVAAKLGEKLPAPPENPTSTTIYAQRKGASPAIGSIEEVDVFSGNYSAPTSN